ncbi:uncharacterized protein LOC131285462 [Anopheles ziemanni]|uniref:uncharacterized protein LOC131266608 n=1 Tax=Anopheles coustani TaxID=139045 RepID=UPI002658C10E|nr:uncharacterized protein LOC131266608 [Anopheles coustani]XP_058170300.1 uncharacterized protein LOC131285462 [Anopheles ziemanni]
MFGPRCVLLVAATLVAFLTILQPASADRYQDNIFFNYYNSSGELVHIYNLAENNTYEYDKDCHPGTKFAVLVFGWKIGCDKYFVQDLIGNLTKHRGGCVICMNYDRFAQLNAYSRLRRNYKEIHGVLRQKLEFLEQEGFSPDDGFMYGFSFGAQVVLSAAKEYGTRKLKEIDVCDIVGTGFDTSDTNAPNHRTAAKNVQCIHTSRNYGTRHRTSCHQDWIMGDCGINQLAAPLSPWGSHGVCTLLYNSAFEHDFLASVKPDNCTAESEVRSWPAGFKMGYTETRKSTVRGQLFSPTFAVYPFNVNVTAVANSSTTGTGPGPNDIEQFPGYEFRSATNEFLVDEEELDSAEDA